MSYDPLTDFLGLLRQTGSAVELARMPGLDFLLAGLERAGLISLWTEQTAPIVNQTSTVWIRPAQPSWTAEGVVFLYDGNVNAFVTATPALWAELLAGATASYVFQQITTPSGVVNSRTSLLAVQRGTVLAPLTTQLTLPALASRVAGSALRIVDWSTINTAEHAIQLLTPDGSTIMKSALWTLYSTPNQLTGVTLYPTPDLNGWIIAP